MTAVHDFLLARVVDGRYLIRRRLGRGSVGAVFEGEHVQTKRRVAIKVLHAALAASGELRVRFEGEAQSASRLSHPACVSVLDFGRIAKIEPAGGADDLLGMPYLVMEFVSGELLLDRMHQGSLATSDALLITRGVLSALRHAHGLGIVHRDVKPENIMLASVDEATPLIKLLDFGLARDLTPEAAASSRALTETGKIFGSPTYLSPEQAGGEPADARSDLYSLGVVLFEMVCGRPPFVRTDMLDVVRDHLETPPPSPRAFMPELSTELAAVILKLLAKDPASRFQSAEGLLSALTLCPEWAATGISDPAWSSPIQLIGLPPAAPPSVVEAAPPPVAEAAPPPVVEAVPVETPMAGDASVANLRSTGWRNVWVALVVLMMAAAVTAGVRRHRVASAEPLPESTVAVPAPESKLSLAGRRHLSVAQDHIRKFWCSAAIDELTEGVREDRELRSEPQLTRTVIPCLRAKNQEKTIQFLVTVVGLEAKPELESALSEDLKPDVRDGVQRALARLAGRP